MLTKPRRPKLTQSSQARETLRILNKDATHRLCSLVTSEESPWRTQHAHKTDSAFRDTSGASDFLSPTANVPYQGSHYGPLVSFAAGVPTQAQRVAAMVQQIQGQLIERLEPVPCLISDLPIARLKDRDFCRDNSELEQH